MRHDELVTFIKGMNLSNDEIKRLIIRAELDLTKGRLPILEALREIVQ